jgi:hypothetical protein
MTQKANKKSGLVKDRSQPFEPIVLPDVATQAHPIVTIPNVPVPSAVQDQPAHFIDMPEDAPVGDYVRDIQLEFEKQQEQGKI